MSTERCCCSTWRRNPHQEGGILSTFTLPLDFLRLFSENCLMAVIHSNRIRLPVFSGQTRHTKGADSWCAFHLFLMVGPSDTGPDASSSCTLLSVIALSSSEGSRDGEDKNLQVRARVPLSTEHPAVSSKANRDPKRPS